jgi:hypothetical protein
MRRLALIAATTIALAGCGGTQHRSNQAPPHHPVVVHSPVVAPAGHRLRHDVQFLSPTRLGIVTYGSSSCPSVPDELVVLTPHRIRIHLTTGSWDGQKLVAHAPTGDVCTTDYGPTPMMLTIDPKLIDVHRPLTIRFFYQDSKKPLVRIAAPLSS